MREGEGIRDFRFSIFDFGLGHHEGTKARRRTRLSGSDGGWGLLITVPGSRGGVGDVSGRALFLPGAVEVQCDRVRQLRDDRLWAPEAYVAVIFDGEADPSSAKTEVQV